MAHTTFSNLFVQTKFWEKMNLISANKRLRNVKSEEIFFLHSILDEQNKKYEISFETDRMKFIGRNNTVLNPSFIKNFDSRLYGTTGAVLDPIASIRVNFKIKSEEDKKFVFLTTVSKDKKTLSYIINFYNELYFKKYTDTSVGKTVLKNILNNLEKYNLNNKILSTLTYSQNIKKVNV